MVEKAADADMCRNTCSCVPNDGSSYISCTTVLVLLLLIKCTVSYIRSTINKLNWSFIISSKIILQVDTLVVLYQIGYVYQPIHYRLSEYRQNLILVQHYHTHPDL